MITSMKWLKDTIIRFKNGSPDTQVSIKDFNFEKYFIPQIELWLAVKGQVPSLKWTPLSGTQMGQK